METKQKINDSKFKVKWFNDEDDFFDIDRVHDEIKDDIAMRQYEEQIKNDIQ